MRAVRLLIGLVLLLLALAVPAALLLPVPVPERAPLTETADAVLVEKSSRRLLLLKAGEVLREYPISLGRQPVGHKRMEGDGRTPEGLYVLDWRNPDSRYHLSLHVSYPDAADRAAAAGRGVPPGGDIMIHGLPNGLGWLGRRHLDRDWTDGCIAVTNQEIEEIWGAVPNGTPIEIRP